MGGRKRREWPMEGGAAAEKVFFTAFSCSLFLAFFI